MYNIDDVVKKFNTTPFLFVGSGLTRRYYGLPDWGGLLKIFARRISEDEFIYNKYTTEAMRDSADSNIYPKIATLIENDFNKMWFSNREFRQIEGAGLQFVDQGVSPFKVEIANYIKSFSEIKPEYQKETQKLRGLTNKSLSGIITTNYDCFLEDIANQYNVYVGQEELVFSPIQGIAEIYKIHGSITLPGSIVITEKDYLEFEKKNAYLAAKLMTIFVEYPILFIGYSITDPDIQSILRSIVECLSNENTQKLQNRFLFVEYSGDFKSDLVEVTPYAMTFQDKIVSMTRIKLNNFELLYDALSKKKTALPVKLLRLFKREFYDFTLTNEPSAHFRVASIDDERVRDDQLIMAVGRASDFGLKGLSGLSSSEWYRDIVKNDLEFSADEMLRYAYPSLISKVNILPLNKYCKEAKKEVPKNIEETRMKSFDDILSATIKSARDKVYIKDRSVFGIWNQQDTSLDKRAILIAHLNEDEISIDELERVLIGIFDEDKDILDNINKKSNEKTNIRRLIRIYDYLKYGKEPWLEVNS